MQEPVRIHIVDDDRDIAESLADLLAMKIPRAEIVTDTTPAAALDRLASWRPHLIISDFRMPEMDGVAFLRLVHERHPGIPAVLMTAYSEQQSAVDAAQRGVIRRWFQKPIDVERLMEGLFEVLAES